MCHSIAIFFDVAEKKKAGVSSDKPIVIDLDDYDIQGSIQKQVQAKTTRGFWVWGGWCRQRVCRCSEPHRTGTSRLMLCQRNCVAIAYSCSIITCCCWSFCTVEALTHETVVSCSSNAVTVFHRSWQSDTCGQVWRIEQKVRRRLQRVLRMSCKQLQL